MKRILLMLVLLMCVVTGAMAEKTPQVIWCGTTTPCISQIPIRCMPLATLTTARPLPMCGAVFLSLRHGIPDC